MNKLNFLTCLITWFCCFYIGFLEWKRIRVKSLFPFRNDAEFTSKLSENILDSKQMMKVLTYIIFIMAIFFRLWKFGIIPGGLNPDSAMAAIDAKSIMQYGTDRFGMRYPVHFTAWGYSQMSVLMSYLMIPFFKIWGMTEITVRMPLFLISILGLLVFYLLVRDIFSEKFAFLVLIIAAFNPWHFVQSRWALDANLLPHFLVFSLFFLYKGIRKRWALYLSMLFFGLCHYCYGISLYIVPVFLLFYSIYLLKHKKITKKHIFISAGIYLFISAPFYLTMFVNAFDLSTITTPYFTIPRFEETRRNKDILFFADNKLEQLKRNASALFYTLFIQESGNGWNTIEGFGTSIICLIPFGFLGCYELWYLWKNEKKENIKDGYKILILYATIAFCSGFITVQVNEWRINPFHYVQILLIALGIRTVYRNSKRVFTGCVFLVIVLEAFFVFRYFSSYDDFWKSTLTYSTYFVEALESVENKTCDTYYITDYTQYDGAWDVSEIETIYIHDLDSLYIQGKTNITGGITKNPYKKQYQYVDIDELTIVPNENAIYIINDFDEVLFSDQNFEIKAYGQYRVVIPRKYYQQK